METGFGKAGSSFAGWGLVITGVTTAFGNFFKMLKDGFSWLNEILMVVGIAIAAVGAVILGVVSGGIAAIVAAIVAAVATIVILVHDNWEAICEWFQTNIVDPIVSVFSDLWLAVKEIWTNVIEWFENYIINPVITFIVGLVKRVQQVFEGLWIIIQAIWILASEWIQRKFIDPIVNAFAGAWKNISGFFKNLWQDIKNIFSNIVNWFDSQIITPLLTLFSGLWKGFETIISSSVSVIVGIVENVLNFLINCVNGIITGFNKVVTWAAGIVGVSWGGVDLIPNISLTSVSVSTYAVGGFPQRGDFFFANENGIPELIGTIGGKPAVASNMEITGISDAIYTTGEENGNLIRTAIDLLQLISQKNMDVNIGDKAIQQASVRGKKRMGMSIITT